MRDGFRVNFATEANSLSTKIIEVSVVQWLCNWSHMFDPVHVQFFFRARLKPTSRLHMTLAIAGTYIHTKSDNQNQKWFSMKHRLYRDMNHRHIHVRKQTSMTLMHIISLTLNVCHLFVSLKRVQCDCMFLFY